MSSIFNAWFNCCESLTWKDVPHRSSVQPAAQTCRPWSWWWRRGLPGLSRLRRWPRWTGSGRRGAGARCWTRPPTASHFSSRAGQSLWEGGERTDGVRNHNWHYLTWHSVNAGQVTHGGILFRVDSDAVSDATRIWVKYLEAVHNLTSSESFCCHVIPR